MKMRVPILLLLLVGGGLLVWLLSSVHRDPKPKATSWSRQINDLNELGRYKHAVATEYAQYATAAETEQRAGAANLFHALSESEQIHEINCADAVRRLGGRYTPPVKVVVFRGTTDANLSRAFKKETDNYNRYRSGSIDSALTANNRYAARLLIRIAGGDMRHIELLECFITHPDSTGYAVCPVCGNTFRTDCCDSYCPFCMTPNSDFVRYE